MRETGLHYYSMFVELFSTSFVLALAAFDVLAQAGSAAALISTTALHHTQGRKRLVIESIRM